MIQTLRRALGCAAVLLMPVFTYNYGANKPIDLPRLMASDTIQFAPDGTTPVFAFYDEEILALTFVETQVWQSGMYFSGAAGTATLPSNPVPWNRIAARLLDSLAANTARIAQISQILDVKLNYQAAQEMRAQAQALRDLDDNSGAFFIAEQCNTSFSFVQRYWKTVQRQSGGVLAS